MTKSQFSLHFFSSVSLIAGCIVGRLSPCGHKVAGSSSLACVSRLKSVEKRRFPSTAAEVLGSASLAPSSESRGEKQFMQTNGVHEANCHLGSCSHWGLSPQKYKKSAVSSCSASATKVPPVLTCVVSEGFATGLTNEKAK